MTAHAPFTSIFPSGGRPRAATPRRDLAKVTQNARLRGQSLDIQGIVLGPHRGVRASRRFLREFGGIFACFVSKVAALADRHVQTDCLKRKIWLNMRFRATRSTFYIEAPPEIGAPVERDLASGGPPIMFDEQPVSYSPLLLATNFLLLKALDRARADSETVFRQASALRRGGVPDQESSDDKEI